jgi:hypothetical protein
MSYFSHATDEQIKWAIMNTGVSSLNEINSLIHVVRNYMKINGFYEVFSIPPRVILSEIQKNGTAILKRKFIDVNSFNTLVTLVRNAEDNRVPERGVDNGLWCATFLETIWCGAFSSDFSAVNNLRVSDIHGDCICIKPSDAAPFEIRCDRKIIQDMIDTANLKAWHRGRITVPIEGDYSDSVFKFERRKKDSNNFKSSFAKRMINISKEYLEYSLSPRNLYVSGLVNRFINGLIEQDSIGFDSFEECLNYVFGVTSSGTKSPSFVLKLISDKLKEFGYTSSFYNLKRYVSGYISDFIPDQSEKPIWIK